jgi:soluble epoxide hydrolase / lipid-phosphate phosphatase
MVHFRYSNTTYKKEKDLLADRSLIKVPYLSIATLQDMICVPQAIKGPKKLGLVPKLTVEEVDASHWCMLASPKEVGDFYKVARMRTTEDLILRSTI